MARADLTRCGMLMVLVPFLAACGSAERSTGGQAARRETGGGHTVTLSMVYAGGDPLTTRLVSQSVAVFRTERPEIAIEEVPSPSGPYSDFVRVRDAVDEFPDIIEMRDTPQYVRAGKLMPLPKELEQIFSSPTLFNGRLYAAPWNANAIGLIYNAGFFREHGLDEHPRTWGEFLTLCGRIRSLGVSPLVMGGKDIWHLGFLINKLLADEVYSRTIHWNTARSAGTVSWTDPGPVRAMRKFVELFRRGYVEPGYLSTPDSQTAAVLVSRRAVGLFSGSWMFQQILDADPSFEIGFMEVPDDQGRIYVSGGPTTNGWSVTSRAAADPRKVAAALAYINFFFRKDQYKAFISVMNVIPTTREPVTYPAIPAQMQLLELYRDYPKIPQFNSMIGSDELPTQFRNWFYKMAQGWLAGIGSVDQDMAKADKEWDSEMKAAPR